jgi:23S rRNA pseudouridine1911/1915/1917 synthase
VTDLPRALTVPEEARGRRLDVFLAENLCLSRAQARRLLARGDVRIDGRRVATSAKGEALRAGATVQVAPFTRPEQQQPLPEPDAPLVVLARGPGWLAIEKPPGVPVHPLEPEETGTVLNAVIARHLELRGVGEGGLRSGVVHRLDVDTSGVLLVATEEEAWQRLRGAFQERRIEKVYRALVRGRLERDDSAVVGLVTARHRPARVRVVSGEEEIRARGVRICSMRWRPLEVYARATLVEVRPETGFLHQIRVVLAHHGFPLLGDRRYGSEDDGSGAGRHMLHAASLSWQGGAAQSPDPEDFEALRAQLAAAS